MRNEWETTQASAPTSQTQFAQGANRPCHCLCCSHSSGNLLLHNKDGADQNISHSAFADTELLLLKTPMTGSESSNVTTRTYWHSSRPWAIAYCGWALLMVIRGWWPVVFSRKKPGVAELLFLSLYFLATGIFAFMAFSSFVRLSADSIEVRRLWKCKILPFTKIKGRRRYTEKADPYSTPPRHLVLEPNNPGFPRIDIKLNERDIFDESFYRWFDSLPDLDKLDGIEPPLSKYTNFSLV